MTARDNTDAPLNVHTMAPVPVTEHQPAQGLETSRPLIEEEEKYPNYEDEARV